MVSHQPIYVFERLLSSEYRMGRRVLVGLLRPLERVRGKRADVSGYILGSENLEGHQPFIHVPFNMAEVLHQQVCRPPRL